MFCVNTGTRVDRHSRSARFYAIQFQASVHSRVQPLSEACKLPSPAFTGLCLLSRASDKCQREKRKTINGDDLLWAMGTLGFEEYVEPLNLYLHKYREVPLLQPVLASAENRPITRMQHVSRCNWEHCIAQGEKASLAKQAAGDVKGERHDAYREV